MKRRWSDDSGAVLIEMAIAAPFLILLCLGIFEYGNAFRQIGGLERAAQQGARVVTAGANTRYADFEALRAVDTATRGLNGITVERVVIFRADSDDGAVPPVCLNNSSPGLCNRYTGEQVRTSSPHGFPGGPSATGCGGGWDSAWCPTSRSRALDELVSIGVHVTVRYESVTNLLPAAVTLTRSAIYQIDPCQQGQTSC